jgi:hypothetical protein
MKRKTLKIAIIGVAGFILVTASSQANLTTVNDNWGVDGARGEWNLYNSGNGPNPGTGIMEYIYGTGNFSRVPDPNDTLWAGSPGKIEFKAVYAGATQNLCTADPTGNSISAILSAQGNSATPSRSGSVATFTPTSQPFLFLDDTSPSGYNKAYSDAALNGGVDRMVTFAVTGYLTRPGDPNSSQAFSDGTHYVLGFEDGTDYDYNDLVVEVSGVAPVPEPATMLAGALLLLPFGASTIRILRKNRAA